ncbi:Glutamate synthase (NADPH) [Bacteroides coprosuis DSM 18011]|uniref:Glutamate synthase (NADPH) n=1 Tax=Bacteroides coprosuis DSM 18011 TaxID=679937 RepID=F3ZTU2_9BACE|nr:NAD(P)-dependent oxidoreductase [Bacteroides coprosuis]EGJ72326.1 Glutamate synthase (NADPH) [Bacteroides coprosuis DSM 18011]
MSAKHNKFKEEDAGYSMKEAINEAKRCLNCRKPSCIQGCPIANDIPDFIHQLSMGNMGAAMTIINEKSNLPAVCGRVCPHEKQCEGNCILQKKGKPIHIGRLERFIADFDTNMDLIRDKIPQKTRGKVAIIGSGPAGLTVAGDLARIGFNVSIIERQEEPGGVLMYGIPEYRLPKKVVRKEIEKIENLGVTFLTNRSVGEDFTIDTIFGQEYDAIFIGSGTAMPKTLDMPGNNLKGIVQSSYFLRMASLYSTGSVEKDEVPFREGENVAIIGCGNVAMDAARTAIRMGAKKVTVISNETFEQMPAIKFEYESALKEGAEFIWETNTKEFLGDEDNEYIMGIKADTLEGEKILHFDRIYLAIGSRPANRIVSTTKGIDVDDTGYVITREKPYGMTTRKGVFAGGDVVHKPQTVVLAMKDAKLVAAGIAQYVDAVKLLQD